MRPTTGRACTASGGADEIATSLATLEAATGAAFDHDEPRRVEYKRISEPVEVVSLRWL